MSTVASKIFKMEKGVDNCKLADLGLGCFLGDIAGSASNSITAGAYEQKPAEKPLNFTYKYDEFKYVIEGELHVKDTESGELIIAKAGDVINIHKGANLDFSAPVFAKIFFVGHRGLGEL